MRFGALPCLLTLLFVSIPSTIAIFADEAFLVDYHLPLLGTPQARKTFFHRPSTTSKASLLYTLSNQNVLGAVNPKDGSLLWRHPLSERQNSSSAFGLVDMSDGADIIFSSVDNLVQTWDAVDGRLLWEARQEGKVKALRAITTDQTSYNVVVLVEKAGNVVEARRIAGQSGDLVWAGEIGCVLLRL